VDWTVIGSQLALGTLLGLLIGYAIKKIVKVVMIILGLLAIVFLAAQHYELITINWETIETAYNQYMQSVSGFRGLMEDVIAFFKPNIAAAGSFTAGFVVGLKWG